MENTSDGRRMSDHNPVTSICCSHVHAAYPEVLKPGPPTETTSLSSDGHRPWRVAAVQKESGRHAKGGGIREQEYQAQVSS